MTVLFFIFSILGWMTEVTLKYFQYHRFIDRGFLIGPCCPIYGAGVEEAAARLETAVAALKERRVRLRELERRFLRRDDEWKSIEKH